MERQGLGEEPKWRGSSHHSNKRRCESKNVFSRKIGTEEVISTKGQKVERKL